MTPDRLFLAKVEITAGNLLHYCRAHNWAGHDPYDALNSELFKALPVLDSRIPRLVLTQLMKRSPVNLRRWLRVPETQNPKAIALFLSAVLKAPQIAGGETGPLVDQLVGRLIALRSAGTDYCCWGYSFSWQTRTIVVPVGAPNLVCTTFVAGALLDLYEQQQDSRWLAMAKSAADYIVNELYWTEDNRAAGFSYPLPSIRVQVYNANFLAAALLCRVYKHTREARFVGPALKVARYSAGQQREDGSWEYGNAPSQRWIDNFHTGYNLGALRQIGTCLETDEFETVVRAGFAFYKSHFFREDGAARYFHDHTYPIDVHCVAQSMITLMQFRDLDPDSARLAGLVFGWAMNHLWDERGFFYYRVLRLGTIRTSYMRWSQAWMLMALATMLHECGPMQRLPVNEVSVAAR